MNVDIQQGIYPFAGQTLSRADIEWLLATHENVGPVSWEVPDDRARQGLDLRGADLSGVDLSLLPLARLRAGLSPEEFVPVHGNHLRDCSLAACDLRGANLYLAHLEGATLTWARLEEASLELASLACANLEDARLEGASLRRANLTGASLRFASFDGRSNLNYAVLAENRLDCARVGDTQWESVNLSLVGWSEVERLGDEIRALNKIDESGNEKSPSVRLTEHRTAVRANRQLSVALQQQGAGEEASRFAYRSNKLQVEVFRRERKYMRYFFLKALDILAGFGYRPLRTFVVYFGTIAIFAFINALVASATSFDEISNAVVISVVNFHGRGFVAAGATVQLSIVSAAEAVVGLLVEAALVATFAQRFLGR